MITSTLSKPLPPLLKVAQVGKLLAISRVSVRGLIQNGELAASIVTPNWRAKKRVHVRITRASFQKFYKKRFGHEADGSAL